MYQLTTAGTLGGTMDVRAKCGANFGDVDGHWYVHAWISQGSTDALRGTILNNYTEASGVNTFGGLVANTFVTPAALTPVAHQIGDWIIVEVGVITRNTYTFVVDAQAYLFNGATDGNPVTAPGVGQDTNILFTEQQLQRVTQLVTLVGYDEDADEDVPPAADPCTSGGTVATGTNPSAGTTLTNLLPEFYVEFTVGGTAVTVRASDVALQDTTMKKPIIDAWGAIVRALPDSAGVPEASTATVRIIDTSGELREYARANILRYQPITIYGINDAARRAGSTPWRVFHGRISDYDIDNDIVFTITAEDHLTAQTMSMLAAEKKVPQNLINAALSDATPGEFLFDKAVPILYGSVSDEDEDEPEGAVQLHYISETSMWDGVLSDSPLAAFLLCGHAISGIQNMYCADTLSGGTPTKYMRVPTSWYNDVIHVPGHFGSALTTKYVDIGGRRYFVVYMQQDHPATILAKNGQFKLRANVCGIEAVGDGTGAVITSLVWQFLHFLINFALQRYETGNWLSIPTSGGYSVIDTATFTAVKTITEARITGGYIGATVLGWDLTQTDLSECIGEWCTSGGFELLENRHGQLALTILDRASAASSAVKLNDSDHILDKGMSIDAQLEATENEVVYLYKQLYVDPAQLATPVTGVRLPPDTQPGDYLSGIQSTIDAGSVSDLGGVVLSSQPQYMNMTRDEATADSVADERLARRCPANGRFLYTIEVPITDAVRVELGDIVKQTNLKGMGTSGITLRRFQVRRHEIHPSVMVGRLGLENVDDLLA